VVHIIPEELSTADMMRVWDTLQPEYRLSLGYVARVVRIEPHDTPEAGPVVATRFNFAVPAQGS
jgi:hypothetical protein